MSNEREDAEPAGYSPRFDEAEFQKLTEKGREAWKSVADAAAWVGDLRGDDSTEVATA